MLGDVTANKVKINTKALEKIQRMKATSQFQPCQLQTTALVVTTDIFTIHCVKIKFFSSPMKRSFSKDLLAMSSHITCPVETWLKSPYVIYNIENYTQIKSERNQLHRSGSLSITQKWRFIICQLLLACYQTFWSRCENRNHKSTSLTKTRSLLAALRDVVSQR